MSVREAVTELFADAGVEGSVCAQNLADGTRVDYRSETLLAMASLYKLPLLIAFARRWQRGELDPRQCITLDPCDVTPGPTGVATLCDPVTTTIRNVAVLMATLSDNAAADAVLAEVGLDAVADILCDAELTDTHVRSGAAQSQQDLLRQTRVRSLPRAFERLASNDALYGDRAYDPTLTSPTTAADMTQLLAKLWRGELVSGEQLAFVQDTLRKQIWPHRMRAGFPYATAKVAGKTGTLGALRHEVGIVDLPNEPSYAVAVLTRAARADAVLPIADRVIGDAARLAVSALRIQL